MTAEPNPPDRTPRPTDPAGGGDRPMCSTCGKPATCHGTYEGITGYGCDDCCGHGCEDGRCVQLKPDPLDPPTPVETLSVFWRAELGEG